MAGTRGFGAAGTTGLGAAGRPGPGGTTTAGATTTGAAAAAWATVRLVRPATRLVRMGMGKGAARGAMGAGCAYKALVSVIVKSIALKVFIVRSGSGLVRYFFLSAGVRRGTRFVADSGPELVVLGGGLVLGGVTAALAVLGEEAEAVAGFRGTFR